MTARALSLRGTSDSRIRWVLSAPFAWVLSAPFASRRARLRAAWHYLVRRYRYEICMECGRPVGPHTGSWWTTSDTLWQVIVGNTTNVLCPPCFTARADRMGKPVHWEAVEGV